MKLIESSVIIKEQEPGINGLYKHIEWAGRHCYKSLDKITEDSAKEFVDRMIKLGHGAMLEHGTVYLKIQNTIPVEGMTKEKWHIEMGDLIAKTRAYENNPYTRISYDDNKAFVYITTNLRVLVENGWLGDLQYQCEPTEHHEKRITAKFICDRGVSHEFVRHRVFSFAQESTRYCNYSKDKFGGEITFIKSRWNYILTADSKGVPIPVEGMFEQSLAQAEKTYFELIEQGWKPQEARQVLPNALKTELIMTGFESDWEHFFELRCSHKAHPDAKKLADELKELLTTVK